MKRPIVLLICGILAASLNCLANPPKRIHKSKPKKLSILFIGNSLTYTNDLPKLVKMEGKARGVKINTTMVAKPNYAISDHWIEFQIQETIKSNKFDYVIIQQGPSSQPPGRQSLIEYGDMIGKLCNENGSKLAYFMVWPSQTYYQTFDMVIKNHTDAAAQTDGLLLPVGKVWKEYFDETNDFSYYGPDGFHPSKKGSQVAAQVILDSLGI